MKLSRPKVLSFFACLWLVTNLCISVFFMSDMHVQDKISTLNYQVIVAKELIVVERDSVKRQNNQLTMLLSQIQNNIQKLPSEESWYYPGDTRYFQNLLSEYIENLETGNEVAIEINSLLVEINKILATDTRSEDVNRLINDVKATVFYALFSDHQQNPTLYRNFDRIYLASEKLNDSDKVVVQKALLLANQLLEKDASLSNAISHLSSLKLENEFAYIHEAFHSRIRLYLITYGVTSFLVLCLFVVGSIGREGEGREGSEGNKRNKEEGSEGNKGNIGSTGANYDNNEQKQDVQCDDLTADQQGIDIGVLQHSMNGDIEAMKLLLGIFIQEHQNDNNLIRNFIQNRNFSMAQNAAHSLKGVAASIGAQFLREIALELEKELRIGQEPTEQELRELDAQLALAIISANEHLGQLNQ